MNKIKFETDYPKLQGLKKVKLIQTLVTTYEDLEVPFLEFDAKQSNGKYYVFNFRRGDKVLLLVFAEPKTYKMFITVRRWTEQKYDYYNNNINKWFEIIRRDSK